MLHAIVSLLDDVHYKKVEEIWTELKQQFQVEGIFVTPYPHFSYQIARGYDLEKLLPVLSRLALRQKPFSVRTSGLGIFTGKHPVIYVPVVRSADLNRFHRQIWQEVSPFVTGGVEYYTEQNWIPHITLAHGDVTEQNVAQLITYLNVHFHFSWEIRIDNLAMIYEKDGKQILLKKFLFSSC